jgi:hypothetical protein
LSKLTARHAELIADKLGAERSPGRLDERVLIKFNGVLIAQYGIRRGSRELPHDYIPKQIFASMRQALDLARCPMSRDDYFENLRRHGRLG